MHTEFNSIQFGVSLLHPQPLLNAGLTSQLMKFQQPACSSWSVTQDKSNRTTCYKLVPVVCTYTHSREHLSHFFAGHLGQPDMRLYVILYQTSKDDRRRNATGVPHSSTQLSSRRDPNLRYIDGQMLCRTMP